MKLLFSGLLESELHSLLSWHQLLWSGKPGRPYKDMLNIELEADKMIPRAQFAQLLRGIHGFLTPTTASR